MEKDDTSSFPNQLMLHVWCLYLLLMFLFVVSHWRGWYGISLFTINRIQSMIHKVVMCQRCVDWGGSTTGSALQASDFLVFSCIIEVSTLYWSRMYKTTWTSGQIDTDCNHNTLWIGSTKATTKTGLWIEQTNHPKHPDWRLGSHTMQPS